MTTYLGKSCFFFFFLFFFRFTASIFRKLLSIYVFSYFPFGSEDRMWDLIVSVPDHCLSFYFTNRYRDYGAGHENTLRKYATK